MPWMYTTKYYKIMCCNLIIIYVKGTQKESLVSAFKYKNILKSWLGIMILKQNSLIYS